LATPQGGAGGTGEAPGRRVAAVQSSGTSSA